MSSENNNKAKNGALNWLCDFSCSVALASAGTTIVTGLSAIGTAMLAASGGAFAAGFAAVAPFAGAASMAAFALAGVGTFSFAFAALYRGNVEKGYKGSKSTLSTGVAVSLALIAALAAHDAPNNNIVAPANKDAKHMPDMSKSAPGTVSEQKQKGFEMAQKAIAAAKFNDSGNAKVRKLCADQPAVAKVNHIDCASLPKLAPAAP